MKDRYLFRAKRTDNDEWIVGHLFQMCHCKKIINPENEHIAYPVDESTICQCTGLKDKNEKLIFENDVVYARCKGLSGKGIIKFEQGCFALDDSKRKRTYSLFGDWILRVDGNIFDNPELLGV